MYNRRRRYYGYRRTYSLKPIKYSSETFSDMSAGEWAKYQPNMETTGNNIPHSFTGNYANVVSATNSTGMRKVKNFSIEIHPCIYSNEGQSLSIPYCWALVYVPEGQNFTPDFGNTTNGGSLYEPNQNVIISGSGVCGDAGPRRFTRMARNLNSGDRIYLLLAFFVPNNYGGPAPALATMSFTCNYAICYN